MAGSRHDEGERSAVNGTANPSHRSAAMSAKIIVSYDGTKNEDDAIALGRLFAEVGATVALAYVRHTHEPDRDRETLAQHEADELLARGAALFGSEISVGRHVVTDRSTPEGLRAPRSAPEACGSAPGPAGASPGPGQPVAGQGPEEVQRAAQEVTGRTRPQPRLEAPAYRDGAPGGQAGARYRGGRAGRREDLA